MGSTVCCSSYIVNAAQLVSTAACMMCSLPICEYVYHDEGVVARWQGYDIMEEMYNQKTAAVNFVQELCKTRSKASLQPVMALAGQVMTEHQVH